MSRTDFPESVKRAASERAGFVCELCRAWPIECHHHRRRRTPGGNTLEACVPLCSHCHAHVHANVEWAFENGWLDHALPVNTGLKVR